MVGAATVAPDSGEVVREASLEVGKRVDTEGLEALAALETVALMVAGCRVVMGETVAQGVAATVATAVTAGLWGLDSQGANCVTRL